MDQYAPPPYRYSVMNAEHGRPPTGSIRARGDGPCRCRRRRCPEDRVPWGARSSAAQRPGDSPHCRTGPAAAHRRAGGVPRGPIRSRRAALLAAARHRRSIVSSRRREKLATWRRPAGNFHAELGAKIGYDGRGSADGEQGRETGRQGDKERGRRSNTALHSRLLVSLSPRLPVFLHPRGQFAQRKKTTAGRFYLVNAWALQNNLGPGVVSDFQQPGRQSANLRPKGTPAPLKACGAVPAHRQSTIPVTRPTRCGSTPSVA